MTGNVALRERPVAIMTWGPAATTAWAASRTGTDICPSWSTRVPSTSRAISILSPARFREFPTRAALAGAAVFWSVMFWCVVRRSSLPATEDSVIVVISQVEQRPPTAARTHATARRELAVNTHIMSPLWAFTRRPSEAWLGSGPGLEDGENRHAAEVLLQGGGDVDGAVGVLVVLQDGDDPAGGGQGAVERGDRPRALGRAVLVQNPFPDVQPARLERGAVRRRGQLPVCALGGDPGLTVKLPGRGIAQIAGGGVNDAVRELALGQHLLFPCQQAGVLGGSVLNRGVDEHLHLVELVDPDDAAGVLAVRARLAPVARALAGIADGAGRKVQDLVGVVAGEGHLRGAHEVQVVFGETVDLGVVLDVKARALHGFRADQGGRDHGDEPGVDRLFHGHLEQRHFQPGADAAQEVEA